MADDLFDALRQINAKLWSIEDDIRVLEAKQDFGNAFVAWRGPFISPMTNGPR